MTDHLAPHGLVAFTGHQAPHFSSLCRPINGVCQGGACRDASGTTTPLNAATVELLSRLSPQRVPYVPSQDEEEDNRRRVAAGMPRRRGRWK